jgi:pimeloyl-ACP methyl ester carboxylesterase
MAESKQLDLGDVRLHYVEAPGPGTPLLLLHAFSDSLESYLPLIPQLSTLAHVYAVDFRGHGESSHTPHNYTLGNHVDDIKRFIDTVVGAPVFIAGHSMGASTAVWLASLYPDTVRALVLEDQDFDFPANNDFPEFAPRRQQLAEVHSSSKTVEELIAEAAAEPMPGGETRLDVFGLEGVQRHARQWLRMDITHFDSHIGGTYAIGWDGKDILSHITCPTVLITSNQWTDDEGIQIMQFYKDNVKHGQRIIIDVPHHRIHEVRPNEYLDAVLGFLKPLIKD